MNRLIFLSTFLFELLTGAFYFGVKFSPARRRWQTAASFIAVGALQYGISMLNMPYVNLTAFILCWFFIGVFVYALRIPAAAFHAGLLAAIMMSTEFVATFLLKLFVDIDMNDLFFGDTFNLMILSFMAKIVYFIGVYIASRFSVREKSVRILAPQTLPLLLLSAATLFVLSGMDETVKRYSPDRPLLLIFSLASGFLLYANLTVFAVHEYTIRLQKKNTELLLRQSKNELDTEHYLLLQRQREITDIVIHDTKKHMEAIRSLAAEDGGEKIAEYIDSVYELEDLRLLRQFSSNKLADVIVNRYYARFLECGIDFYCDIRDIDLSFLTDGELTALLDNLLSNALDAAADAEKKFVELTVEQRNLHYVAVRMANACAEAPKKKYGRFVSSKKEGLHGVGLNSIAAVAKKHGGSVSAEYHAETKTFETVVVLECGGQEQGKSGKAGDRDVL